MKVKMKQKNKKAHLTTSNEIIEKLIMEMMEKMRNQTMKTSKKIMMTLIWNASLLWIMQGLMRYSWQFYTKKNCENKTCDDKNDEFYEIENL